MTLTWRDPDAPRFLQRGEGSGEECRCCSFVTVFGALHGLQSARLLARSLTRLNYAEFRDDASPRGGVTTPWDRFSSTGVIPTPRVFSSGAKDLARSTDALPSSQSLAHSQSSDCGAPREIPHS